MKVASMILAVLVSMLRFVFQFLFASDGKSPLQRQYALMSTRYAEQNAVEQYRGYRGRFGYDGQPMPVSDDKARFYGVINLKSCEVLAVSKDKIEGYREDSRYWTSALGFKESHDALCWGIYQLERDEPK